MAQVGAVYPARYAIDYPDRDLDRFSTFFRLLFILPIAAVLVLLGENGAVVLFGVVLLMILFRQKYPRWWFDWNLQLLRFQSRVGAYLFLMSDEYPSTDDEQYVHLDLEYPDAHNDLNRFLPLVKWLLAIPHYVVLALLLIAVVFVLIYVWFAILLTGRYPRGAFDFVVGVQRWTIRVQAYALLLVTDMYPPFRLGS